MPWFPHARVGARDPLSRHRRGAHFTANELRAGVRLTPNGNPPLYLSTDIVGIPDSAPPVEDSQVFIQRTFYTLDGKPWVVAPLKEGDALIVGLKIEARVAMPDALLVDLLPGGLEIENFNLTDAKQWADVVVGGITLSDRSSAADVQHEEFRDDRYVAALKLDQGQEAHVFICPRRVTRTYRCPLRGRGHVSTEIRGIPQSVDSARSCNHIVVRAGRDALIFATRARG